MATTPQRFIPEYISSIDDVITASELCLGITFPRNSREIEELFQFRNALLRTELMNKVSSRPFEVLLQLTKLHYQQYGKDAAIINEVYDTYVATRESADRDITAIAGAEKLGEVWGGVVDFVKLTCFILNSVDGTLSCHGMHWHSKNNIISEGTTTLGPYSIIKKENIFQIHIIITGHSSSLMLEQLTFHNLPRLSLVAGNSHVDRSFCKGDLEYVVGPQDVIGVNDQMGAAWAAWIKVLPFRKRTLAEAVGEFHKIDTNIATLLKFPDAYSLVQISPLEEDDAIYLERNLPFGNLESTNSIVLAQVYRRFGPTFAAIVLKTIHSDEGKNHPLVSYLLQDSTVTTVMTAMSLLERGDLAAIKTQKNIMSKLLGLSQDDYVALIVLANLTSQRQRFLPPDITISMRGLRAGCSISIVGNVTTVDNDTILYHSGNKHDISNSEREYSGYNHDANLVEVYSIYKSDDMDLKHSICNVQLSKDTLTGYCETIKRELDEGDLERIESYSLADVIVYGTLLLASCYFTVRYETGAFMFLWALVTSNSLEEEVALTSLPARLNITTTNDNSGNILEWKYTHSIMLGTVGVTEALYEIDIVPVELATAYAIAVTAFWVISLLAGTTILSHALVIWVRREKEISGSVLYASCPVHVRRLILTSADYVSRHSCAYTTVGASGLAIAPGIGQSNVIIDKATNSDEAKRYAVCG